MPKRDRPFAVYRRASGMFTIVPRGLFGWTQLIVWLALLAGLAAWFYDHYITHYQSGMLAIGVVLFIFGLIAWTLCFLWWVFARAEVIDREVWRRDQERKKQRRR